MMINDHQKYASIKNTIGFVKIAIIMRNMVYKVFNQFHVNESIHCN